MRKIKLLFTTAALLLAGGISVSAQTDVTSTYLVNPSFETLKASDGTTDVTVKTTLSSGLYGWEVPSMSNYQVESEASGSSSGFVNGGKIVPTDGTYYYFNRQGWANKDSELKTTTKAAVAPGNYYFVFDYKAADYSNNNNASKNGTTIGITVKDASSNTIATLPAAKIAYSITNGGSNPGSDAYMKNAPWSKKGVAFTVTSSSVLTFAVQQNMKNSGRSDIVYDNFKLYKIDGATDVDFTGYIANPGFEAENENGWTATTTFTNWGANALSNGNKQQWNGNYSVSQVITNLPNGKYKIAVQGFYRPGGSGADLTAQNALLFAGDSYSIGLKYVSSEAKAEKDDANGFTTAYGELGLGYVPNSQEDAKKAFESGAYNNELPFYVTNHSITVGSKKETLIGDDWTVFDNFKLYLQALAIENYAETYTAVTSVTADKWYVYDVPANGDYRFISNVANTITYTQTGTDIDEDVSTNETLTADTKKVVALSTGKLYFKVSTDATLTVEPDAYTYSLGDGTPSVANNGYTQSSSFTVTFPDAVSSDPGASATLIASAKATVNGSEIALAAVTNGFSVNLGTLTPSTDYVIAIPANVYGYEGQSMNNAIEVTVHTPAVFDGEYCLYDATNKLFLGRGCAYGTEAAADKYGIPFNLVTDATGKSAIEFVDWTGVYLFSTNSGNEAGMYTDNASTGWKFVSVTGGFYLKDFNGEFYAKVDNGGYGYYVHTIAGTANATIWTLKTKAERDAIIASYPAENISNVIAAAGITTTPAEFLTYMSSNYNAVDATANIGTATFAGAVGDWTWSQIRDQKGQPAYGTNFVELWNATGSYSQTIGKTNLPAGIYKVTVQGYERRRDNTAATALYAAGYNNVSTYLSANGEQVRFTDWNEVDGKPTNTGDAVTAFNKGEATNVVYIYLDGNTDLTLTVKKPCYIWDNWAILNNFTLTRYELKSENITVSAAGFATYASDNDLDFSGVTGLTAYKATVSGTSINFTKVTTVPAGEGVLIKADAGNYSIPVTTGVAAWAADDNAFVRGTGAAVASNDGSVYNYVLSKHNEEVGFYPASGKTVGSDKAYISTTIDAARLTIAFDDETTGISSALMNSEKVNGVYNLNGQRVNKAQKGLYIINGKKVIK